MPSLLALILAYLRVTQFDRSIPFALFSVVLAADFYLAAYRFGGLAEAARTPATRLATGAFAAGVAAAITLAFVMVLERGYLTVAFAVTALTTAIVADRHRIPLLRAVVAALGFIVLGRLVWDPRIMGAAVGTWPVFNWLLIGYGVPALAFLAAGFVLKREREDLAVRICDALGVLFAALLGVLRDPPRAQRRRSAGQHLGPRRAGAVRADEPRLRLCPHAARSRPRQSRLPLCLAGVRRPLGRLHRLRPRHHREPAAQQRATSSACPSSAR